jgi:hypothetical protein
MIDVAYTGYYAEPLPRLEEARDAIAAVYSSAGNQHEAAWLTYRLLWAIPWSARDVSIDATAANALGAIFDIAVLNRHASRATADLWVAWSSKWTRHFGAAWVDLLKARHVPPEDFDDVKWMGRPQSPGSDVGH